MPTIPSTLADLDRQFLIHPVTNPRAHEKKGVIVLESGKGVFLRDSHGKDLLDAFAGLWCVNIGYGHESVVAAAAEQMRKLPYATAYFDYGSEPAIRLAAKLVSIAPKSLRHVYFTLGGSDAVDSAIRLITLYYNAIGRPSKKHFIALERGYHGSTATGAGMTALAAFHARFDLPLPAQHHIPSPYPYRHPAGADPPRCPGVESPAAVTDAVSPLPGRALARPTAPHLPRLAFPPLDPGPVVGTGGSP